MVDIFEVITRRILTRRESFSYSFSTNLARRRIRASELEGRERNMEERMPRTCSVVWLSCCIKRGLVIFFFGNMRNSRSIDGEANRVRELVGNLREFLDLFHED